jgi:ring-1,2-phenylacetyl-CoA epoxidase subunit PaaE
MDDNSLVKRVVIGKKIRETRSAYSFVLDAVGWQPSWRAGQFITLVFHTPHGEKRRSYSISSSPHSGEPLKITVKRIENGEFSRRLCDHAREGDVLYTTGIAGFFTLTADAGKFSRYTFLAAGSGIVPCYPLIRELLSVHRTPVTLFYSNRSREDTIFYEELTKLAEEHPTLFSLSHFISGSKNIFQGRLSKWLFAQVLDSTFGKQLGNTQFYLCGPFEYMQTLKIVLLTRTEAAHIHTEQFGTWPRLILPKPPDDNMHMVTVQISGYTHSFSVQYPTPVTRAARAAGVSLPYSCEAGRCGSCVASILKGKFWMAYNEVLTDREVNSGRVLACQAFPVGGDGALRFE